MLNELQRASRSLGIGGSDAASAVGRSRYRSRGQLWRYKTRREEPEELTGDHIDLGNRLEPVLGEVFTERTGLKLRRVNKTLVHPKYPFMRANVDRMVVGRNEGVEIKTAGLLVPFAYKVFKDWGESGTDFIPDDYLYQCMHYMEITDAERWHLFALIAGRGYVHYVIERNEDLLKSMVTAEQEFWHYVQSDTMPPPLTDDECNEAWEADNGAEVEATLEIAQLAGEINEIKSSIKSATKHMDSLKVRVKSYMKDAGVLTFGGQKIAGWKRVESDRIDVDMLRQLHPSIAQEVTKISVSRPFR